MIAPEAPASWAFTTFSANVQVPRCIRAIASAVKPAKSASSQPDVDVRCSGTGFRFTSIGTMVCSPVSPLAE